MAKFGHGIAALYETDAGMYNGSSLVVAVLNVHKFAFLLDYCLHANPDIEV